MSYSHKPLVSVLMAAFNGEKFIEAAINSILNQTYQNFELIIVDDGSSDNTVSLVRSFGDERIRLLQNTENKGLFFTRNRLFQEAQGVYLAILDCDDISLPHRLAYQVDFLEKHPNISVVGSWVSVINEAGMSQKTWKVDTEPHKVQCKLLFINQFANSSIMMRKSIAKLGYRRQYPVCEDYDLWVRASYKYQLANLPYILLHYRVHGENITEKKQHQLKHNIYSIYTNQLERLHISPAKHELELHKTIGNLCIPVHDRLFVEAAERWLRRLHTQNDHVNIYPQDTFNGLLGEYWGEILSHNLDIKDSKTYLANSILSDFIPQSKQQALKAALQKRVFPLNHLLRWKKSLTKS